MPLSQLTTLAIEAELLLSAIYVCVGCLQGPALGVHRWRQTFGQCAGRVVTPIPQGRDRSARPGGVSSTLSFLLLVHLHKAGKAAYLG